MSGLTSLLYPRTPTEFFSHLFGDEPFFVDKTGLTDALTGLPGLESLEALWQAWQHPVQAHLPKIADEASSIEVSVDDSRKLFENGMGLMFDHAERLTPELPQWLETIRGELGLSAISQSRCLIYATPAGKGTAPHFDQNINFVLQLHGTKRWWLTPNSHVTNPLSRHTMGLAPDPELATYADDPLPTKMPADATEVVLKPGSLLFVPRGTWHSTRADSDALALNFTYTSPAWLDLFLAALRSRLALSPEWRATANGVGDTLRREKAGQTFGRLLAGLVDDLPNWTADEILEVTEGTSGD